MKTYLNPTHFLCMTLGLGWAAIVFVAPAQSTYDTIKAFGVPAQSSSWPTARLVEGPDGALYGTSQNGGVENAGTVFKLNKDGSGCAILKSFTASTGDLLQPSAELILASDGLLYGTAPYGGISNGGGVFRIRRDGTGYESLLAMTDGTGANPRAGLLEATDGLLYGTATYGGISNQGTIFKLSKDGTTAGAIHLFTSQFGANPQGRLVQGTDGVLYGTTVNGGPAGKGVVFSVNPDGTSYTVLWAFSGTNGDGANPYGGLTFGTNGVLYGMTRHGGAFGGGTVFKVNRDGTLYSVIKGFSGTAGDGQAPYDSLVSVDGVLFGITTYGGNGYGTVFRINLQGDGYTVIKQFAGFADACNPQSALLQGSDGALYGTTPVGGSSAGGTVFKVNADGTGYTIVKNFSASGNDGSHPQTTLLPGLDGMLYGTTWSGGTNNRGTVFKLNPDGSGYSLLKSFTVAEGSWPYGDLMQTRDGTLFGTTLSGGAPNLGTIYKLNPDGSGFSVLKEFSTSAEGYSPYAGLMQASNGMLYGTTQYGGNGGGVVFRLNSDGTGFTVLRSFTDKTNDPAYSFATLIQGSDGALYGTSAQGGIPFEGNVFKINLDGTGLQVLHTFTSTNGDGAFPHTPLLETSDHVLYGLTSWGGISNLGTIFEVNLDGTGYKVVRSFTGAPFDGSFPSCLVQRNNGLLYGATGSGGAANRGTVFQLNPDGTAYAILYHFTVAANVRGLAQTADGRLYGGTWSGGGMRFGTLFSIDPAPFLMPPKLWPDHTEVHLTGIPGRTCRMEVSSSLLGPWTALGLIAIGPNGNAVYDDAPHSVSAFYRVLYP